MIYTFILVSNPFVDSYTQSDLLGKLIYMGLVFLSIISWIILIQKVLICRNARKNSENFWQSFQTQRLNPLNLETTKNLSSHINPIQEIYFLLKKYTLEILNKNAKFGGGTKDQAPSLSPTDIDFVQAQLISGISNQTKYLEKNLFVLSTVVTLAPFLGLLGTVWGILTSFSEMESLTGGGQASILSGLSLALATTVLGLIDAIPAVIAYNYLKNFIRDFETDLTSRAQEMLASVEMQYRRVDV